MPLRFATLALALLPPARHAAPLRAPTLANATVRAEFGPRGLTRLIDRVHGDTHAFARDGFSLTIDGRRYDSRTLHAPTRRDFADSVTYAWTAGPYRVGVTYELQPSWRFVSKRLSVTTAAPAFHLDSVVVWDDSLTRAPGDVYVVQSTHQRLGPRDYGAALRFGDRTGLLAVVQNPFLSVTHAGGALRVSYAPEMDWRSGWGAFKSDRGLLAPYRLSGTRLPDRMRPEWALDSVPAAPGLDLAERDAFTNMVRAFLIDPPATPISVFVGWTANDYQIDVATPAGRTEYERLLHRAAQMGAEYALYAPSNSAISRRDSSVDDWSWEHVLWLGLGQQIRKNQWHIASSPIPPSVQAMLDYARSQNIKLLAYVYPVLPFTQDSAWLVTSRGKQWANLGIRAWQDWLIKALVEFHDRTGIGGYSFDHTFLTYPGASVYAQWYGWRRVMETIKRDRPDLVIDGRQAYQEYGPWSWLAGSYPHPTSTDEQPESFLPFPDLHFDRVSADRERYTAYKYRNYEFAPSEIVPGYITHQTSRSDGTGDMPFVRTDSGPQLVRFRARDWDYLGWRYSLISSIAIAGWNNVIDMIPARDSAEYADFSPADAGFFRHWIAWTAAHRELLRRTRTIIGQPAVGRVDGTAAAMNDSGFVFLFNPNARRLTADFALDSSLGLAPGAAPALELREVYPREGMRIGKPGVGPWRFGDRVSIPMEGASAVVLEVRPVDAAMGQTILYGAPGTATASAFGITVRDVTGEPGTTAQLLVKLPAGATPAPDSATVNGVPVAVQRITPDRVALDVHFAGTEFGKLQPVGPFDSTFTGGTFHGSFTIPQRIFDQLEARQRAWPIPWTTEDFETTWLAPQRLLLFVDIAQPDSSWEPRMTIDGREVALRKAYSSVRPVSYDLVGYYADVSLLSADVQHTVELRLPALRPGQFQGLFFENVEPLYTDAIVRNHQEKK
ncbi:MAG: hypothetical protein KGL93_00415 [Gemmatimonadota bacterium]|nr:hypothetical protein [Gemmatimonadota bacterium]